ncbi:hypothetical protein MASR2M78_29020 [Treponema sp.]
MRPFGLRLLSFSLLILCAGFVFGQSGDQGEARTESALASKYVSWALSAMEEGRYLDAEAALERSQDYADLSSDLSYLLALSRLKLDRSMGSVLVAARRAIQTDRWDRYGKASAMLIEAEALLRMRAGSEVLYLLSSLDYSNEVAYLRAKALSFGSDYLRFRRELALALEAFPTDTRLIALVFDTAKMTVTSATDKLLVQRALDRLPFLLGLQADLALKAAPFISDIAERSRLVSAFRASHSDVKSIPLALNLGLISEETAIEELFSLNNLDISILDSVYSLLRTDSSRSTLSALGAQFNGTIVQDSDKDGYAESSATYKDGFISSYTYDADQDGLAEMEIRFADMLPVHATLVIAADVEEDPNSASIRLASMAIQAEDRRLAELRWLRFPYVAESSYAGIVYKAAANQFPYAPIRLEKIRGTSLRFPQLEKHESRLSLRSLISFAYLIERPSLTFPGAIERIEILKSIPLRATEILNGRVVSVLTFNKGKPELKKLDLDIDGRMETSRYYKTDTREASIDYVEIIERTESDWDGDGRAEYAEVIFADGSIERSWDMDGDGKRERIERSR